MFDCDGPSLYRIFVSFDLLAGLLFLFYLLVGVYSVIAGLKGILRKKFKISFPTNVGRVRLSAEEVKAQILGLLFLLLGIFFLWLALPSFVTSFLRLIE